MRPHGHELVVVLQVAQHRACGGSIQQQALQRQPAIEAAFVVHHVDGIDVFDIGGLGPDFADGTCHCPIFLNLDHFHGHQRAGCAVFVAQQLEDLGGRLHVVHHAHGFLDFGLRQVRKGIGSIVGIQPLDDVLGDLL